MRIDEAPPDGRQMLSQRQSIDDSAKFGQFKSASLLVLIGHFWPCFLRKTRAVVGVGSPLITPLPSVRSGDFCAVYYKANPGPQIELRRRSPTDDHELLARSFQEGARAGVDRLALPCPVRRPRFLPVKCAREPQPLPSLLRALKPQSFGYLQPGLLTSATTLPTHWLDDRFDSDVPPCGV